MIEEVVCDPVLRVQFPIELGTLDVDGLVRWIEANIPNRSPLPRGRLQTHLAEKRRRQQVDVLSCDWEKSHESECGKCAHGTVIVARNAVDAAVELPGNVLM